MLPYGTGGGLYRVSSGLHKNRNLSDRKVKIPIERGVRQGDTISPRLFTAALRYAISELDWEGKGYSIDTKKISNLRFVDDIALIANSTAEMETTVNELNVVGLKIGLEMNMSKTQPMVNQWCDAVEVNLAVYLGRELNMRNNIAPEITRRRRAAWAAFGSIREVSDKVKEPALRAYVFNATVPPAMLRDRNVV
ncbi:hypothetical protein ANCCEY_11546 [Ancylostoma ceylanicum]|uniref:Reverse transcriptase domain-containing protein n=1 Tax=Ancylostoma ceylanicum TaxID=53326 RepID=A0A0D6LBX0_9BILA|nr:hypothetical protein ANCCEY_11546 [Ancylostoma ceylanicum]